MVPLFQRMSLKKSTKRQVTPAVVSQLGDAGSEKARTVWLLWKITAWRDVGRREKLNKAAEQSTEGRTAAEGFRRESFCSKSHNSHTKFDEGVPKYCEVDFPVSDFKFPTSSF